MEVVLQRPDVALDATLVLPDGPVRGGCVALHPSGDGSRHQPLLQHLAGLLAAEGVALLLHDRRPAPPGQDVPLAVQAGDALAAAEALRAHVGPVPVGLWGWSQGAWAASLAASLDPTTAFLVLVACAGVSPAEQMRHGTAEQLRRHGHDDEAVRELLAARAAYEAALRGDLGHEAAQDALARAATRPWWHLAWLPDVLDPADTWPDMDVDPVPVFAATTCPVLAVWGDDDPWVPVRASAEAWQRVAGDRVTVLCLPGVGHGPEPGDARYEAAVLAHVRDAVESGA